MAAINHYPLHQLDIKNSFLYRESEEEMYMDKVPGFTVLRNSRLVCRFHCSLYGLKQSPHAWFGHFKSALIQFGMTRCEADHSVFFLHSSTGQRIFLVVYVNDIVITGDDTKVSMVSQFLSAPCNTHWNAVIRVLRYIKNAPGTCLLYEDKGDAKITCYSDADWVGSHSDMRSTYGYYILIRENMISWRSNKQNTFALSSAEAEYHALVEASKELA
ncbi:secreted RxLR effector protein 161-like [Lathyrus oleraceus]|uniref:secreted RxLR effector protein 161-like n=1 Tax=Pisum sativum TaxID=3888 RepID=UPI0021D3A0F2|nr:secreted RxLR effector protein 161-like [Pisum sativum]